uniref:Nuclear VCP like n=1 Tax=Oncorhynchus kisutch TaxID=8019 RepID=A0A8C7KQF5_ONCKI
SNQSGKYVDISSMAEDLQRFHRMDYGRQNKTAFTIQVEKVHGVICDESGLTDLENKHLAKRAKHSQKDTKLVFPSDYPLPDQPINLMSLYKKGNPESGTSPKREQSASDSPAQAQSTPHSCGTKVSAGGWFKNKGRGPEQDSILIDLCKEEAASPAGNVCLTASYAVFHQLWIATSMTKSIELQYSTLKFEDVGGNEDTLAEVCKLLIHMRHPELYQQLGVVPPRGFLLHGPPGCGKTLLAQAVAGEMELPLLKVSVPELVSGVSGESEQKLRELFEQAVTSSPWILFIDEIDDTERWIVSQLLTCMDDLNSLAVTAQVMDIGATNQPGSLDPALRRAGRFDKEICLGIPDEAARLRNLKTLCRKLKLPEDFDYQQLARLTPGYVGAELMALCREAAMSAVDRVLLEDKNQGLEGAGDESCDMFTRFSGVKMFHFCLYHQGELCHLLSLLKSSESLSEEQMAGLCILMSDFQGSLASVQPSAKSEGFVTVPDVTWKDVGALHDIRKELTMAFLAPVRSPEQFKAQCSCRGVASWASRLWKDPAGQVYHFLLFQDVANESGLNLISVKGPELLNMVRRSAIQIPEVPRRHSFPCDPFDEIDSLCPCRSGHASGASVRVVNQLLTKMDRLEARRQVFIMAATNRPGGLLYTNLRPGRLDKTLYVGLPPPSDRHAILLIITRVTKPHLEQDVSLEEIARDVHSDCFTCLRPDLLVREASVNALRAYLLTQPNPSYTGHSYSNGPVADIRVSKKNFEDTFKKVWPSVSKKVRCIGTWTYE